MIVLRETVGVHNAFLVIHDQPEYDLTQLQLHLFSRIARETVLCICIVHVDTILT